jgi:hypothetical protein
VTNGQADKKGARRSAKAVSRTARRKEIARTHGASRDDSMEESCGPATPEKKWKRRNGNDGPKESAVGTAGASGLREVARYQFTEKRKVA